MTKQRLLIAAPTIAGTMALAVVVSRWGNWEKVALFSFLALMNYGFAAMWMRWKVV